MADTDKIMKLEQMLATEKRKVQADAAELERLRQWVNDLQSGMYINCVYCGYRYGPRESTPATMADVLKKHIEQCPEHPCSKLKARIKELEAIVAKLPKYADTGEPILRGMVVWLSGGPLGKPGKYIVESIRATSVLLDGMPRLSTHQRHCYSTREAAKAVM